MNENACRPLAKCSDNHFLLLYNHITFKSRTKKKKKRKKSLREWHANGAALSAYLTAAHKSYSKNILSRYSKQFQFVLFKKRGIFGLVSMSFNITQCRQKESEKKIEKEYFYKINNINFQQHDKKHTLIRNWLTSVFFCG